MTEIPTNRGANSYTLPTWEQTLTHYQQGTKLLHKVCVNHYKYDNESLSRKHYIYQSSKTTE